MNQDSLKNPTDPSGLTVHSLLGLPEEQRRLLNWMGRQNICYFQQIVEFLGQGEETTFALLHDLGQQGFIQEVSGNQQVGYKVNLTSMRRHRLINRPAPLPQFLLDQSLD